MRRQRRRLVIILCVGLGLLSFASLRGGYANEPAAALATAQVAATVETVPVPHSGDAADDPAIWIHPTDPSLSTIIGTDKQGGLAVYDLAGHQLQYLPDGELNNVDLRYNFPLGGQPTALVTAGNRTTNSIAIYRVNPATRTLENVAARTIIPSLTIYGSCMYHSPFTGKYYLYLNAKSGVVEQWQLFATDWGQVDAVLVRTFDVGTQVEGCVADDELSSFYIAEEAVAIWKYGAEPGSGTTRTAVDTTGAQGHLTSNIEGLTVYYASNGAGYLIASSQGSDNFVVYERGGDNAYVMTCAISAGNSIDGVTGTDGIDVTNFGLGGIFSQGVFIAQDSSNDNGNQNYKLVPWQAIAQAAAPALTIDTTWDLRLVGAGTPPAPPPPLPPPGNLLANPGFELDANSDNRPDTWTSSSKFTRSSTLVHGGSVSGKLAATDNSGVTISQVVNLVAGVTYRVICWVNIPQTNGDSFSFKPQVRWRNASNSALRTDTLETYTSATSGWDQAASSLVAPVGTTNAMVRLVASSLNLAIYIDDCSLQRETAIDTTPPHVVARSPALGALGVDIATNVTATFDELLNSTTLTDSSFMLLTGDTAIPSTVMYDTTTRTAILNPAEDLAVNTTYTAQLSDSIADLAGNRLTPVSWTFTTTASATTPTATSTATASATPVTSTLTPTATDDGTTPTTTSTPTPSTSATPTATSTPTPTASATPTATSTPTSTPSPTATATATSSARIKDITFEASSLTGSAGADSIAGSVVLRTTQSIKGTYAAWIASAGSSYLQEDFSATDDLFVSLYVRVNALPASDVRLVQVSNAGTTVGGLVLRPNGALRLRNGSTTIGVESAPLSAGAIYRIGLHQKRGSGGNALLEAYIVAGDVPFGTSFAATASGTWITPADRLRVGATTSAVLDAMLDDIRIDTAQMPLPSP